TAGRAAVALTDSLPGDRPNKPYLSNAKGAVWGGGVMLVVSLLLAGHAGRTALGTDWSCAFSERAAECLQPEKKAPKQCAQKTIVREEWVLAKWFGGTADVERRRCAAL